MPSIENRFQRVRDATLREEDPLLGNDLTLRVPAVVASQSRSSCGALSGWGARTYIPAEPSDSIRCHGFPGGKAPNRELGPDRLPRSKPSLGPDGLPRMRRHYGEADGAGERRGMPGIGPAGMVPVWTNLDRGGLSASIRRPAGYDAWRVKRATCSCTGVSGRDGLVERRHVRGDPPAQFCNRKGG